MRTAEVASGHTLVEVLLVLAIAGILIVLGTAGYRAFEAGASLDGAANVVRGQLARARMLAVARRQTVRVRIGSDGDLVLLGSADSVLGRTGIGAGSALRVDSIRLRPATLRFNSRGQAAPGSVYLYRGRKGVRLVSNFLGRVRRESF